MTDLYILLIVLAALVVVALLGVWAYRTFSKKAPAPSSRAAASDVSDPPLEPRGRDAVKERRARAARMSSTMSDGRRY